MTESDRYRRAGARALGRAVIDATDPETVVVGIPTGGVTLALEIADMLSAPLDICVVRRLGPPSDPLLAFGAVAEGGVLVLDRDAAARSGMSESQIARQLAVLDIEVRERVACWRRSIPAVDVAGKTVVLIDDGIVTGNTARAALAALRRRGARRTVLAALVATGESLHALEREAHGVVCLRARDDRRATEPTYRRLGRISEARMIELVSQASRRAHCDSFTRPR